MIIISENTFAEAYREALRKLVEDPDYIAKPRGYTVNEITDASIEIKDITKNLFSNSNFKFPVKYLKHELALYLSGRNDAESFSKASKFWDSLKNKDGTVNSAYGNLIFKMKDNPQKLSQFEWAYQSLSLDRDTRQAVMFFNRPCFQYFDNKDFVCTLDVIFHIRDNKLYMRAGMRSNDIRRGTLYDIPFFMFLQYGMYKRLKNTVYPNLELGSYIHYASSLHLYHNLTSKDGLAEAESMLRGDWIEESFPYPDSITDLIMSKEIDEYLSTEKVTEVFSQNNRDFLNWLQSV
jgi:thymidylate synthase